MKVQFASSYVNLPTKFEVLEGPSLLAIIADKMGVTEEQVLQPIEGETLVHNESGLFITTLLHCEVYTILEA